MLARLAKRNSSRWLQKLRGIATRKDIISHIKAGKEFDVLVVGGGATGTGAALDAANRGLSVCCVEREDFASGTSSRSTKLIWGGSRYLVQAIVRLLSFDLVMSPVKTVKSFVADFKMVLNCHRERTFLLKTQPHLTYWQPIAVPITKWIQWPPPFNFPLAAFGPLGMYPIFFKIYDALSKFSSPPSHIMTPKRAKRKFPQLSTSQIKYCPVFYEGMHDDARTNLAIALTAEREGAAMLNYCEVVEFIHDTSSQEKSGKVVGARLRDNLTGESFDLRAKSVLLCGGPFTDELRKLENPGCKAAVSGAAGIHIMLPKYFAPAGIGLVDMNTSDGRFLFFLPWQDHVIVGTTDNQAEPTMHPEPHEAEIRWLLREAAKYLSPELQIRRTDVLSAWAGIRPLASNPYSSSSGGEGGVTSSASRDHVVAHNETSGIVFVSGGKWTTYREMAEDAVDKVVEVTPELKRKVRACNTLNVSLVGLQGFSDNLEIRLIQSYGVSSATAHRLATAYGGRAHVVLQIGQEVAAQRKRKFATSQVSELEEEVFRLLVPGFPYLEAEVLYAVRHEWAHRPEDFLARRTRLAFLNKTSAMRAIPRVVQLMARELKWSEQQQSVEMKRCIAYMRQFGGPKVALSEPSMRMSVRLATEADMKDVYRKVSSTEHGFLTRSEVQIMGELLNHPLSDEELDDCMGTVINPSYIAAADGAERVISYDTFSKWWNSERFNPGLKLLEDRIANPVAVQGSGTMFG